MQEDNAFNSWSDELRVTIPSSIRVFLRDFMLRDLMFRAQHTLNRPTSSGSDLKSSPSSALSKPPG